MWIVFRHCSAIFSRVSRNITRRRLHLPADISGHPVGPGTGTSYAYKMFQSHIILRYNLSHTRIAPYLEALVGVNRLLTEKSLGTRSSVPFFSPEWL